VRNERRTSGETSVVVNEASHARLGNGAARKNKAYVTTRVAVKNNN